MAQYYCRLLHGRECVNDIGTCFGQKKKSSSRQLHSTCSHRLWSHQFKKGMHMLHMLNDMQSQYHKLLLYRGLPFCYTLFRSLSPIACGVQSEHGKRRPVLRAPSIGAGQCCNSCQKACLGCRAAQALHLWHRQTGASTYMADSNPGKPALSLMCTCRVYMLGGTGLGLWHRQMEKTVWTGLTLQCRKAGRHRLHTFDTDRQTGRR